MPTYLINGDERLPVAPGQLHVTARRAGSPAPVRMSAESGGRPVDRVQHPTPTLMIVPRVDGPTVIRVLADPGTAFPDATTINLQLEVRSGQRREPDVIQINAIDVSGLTDRELVLVEPDGANLVVSTDAEREEQLDDLAARARAEGRGLLPARRNDRDGAGGLLLGVDVSASMRPVFDDGTVDALLQVLIGLSYVVGKPGEVRVGLLGVRPRWLPSTGRDELAGHLRAAVTEGGFEVGFDPAAPAPVGPGPHTLYLLTDAVPADLPAVSAAVSADDVARHVVVAGPAPATGGPLPDGVFRTIVEPPPRPLGDHLLESPPAIRSLVSSLLASWTSSSDTAVGARR